MGKHFHSPRHSNPKGFFETVEINLINEIILSRYDTPKIPFFTRFLTKNTIYRPARWQRWLMALPSEVSIATDSKRVGRRIKAAVAHKPFAYKDPRFSYTLPVWKPYLDKDTVFICVFREPNVTIKSILKECASMRYLRSLEIDEQTAYESWFSIYSHILENHLHDTSNLAFVHFTQVYDGSALPTLSERLDADLKHDFVDKALNRTKSDCAAPQKIQRVYGRLCDLAGYV